MRSDEKLCPFCAEAIKAAAIRCRYCQADLSIAPATLEQDAAVPSGCLRPLGGAILSVEVGDLLASLAEKSLVTCDQESGRYRLMESVADYGRTVLAKCGESEALRARHLGFFLELAERAAPELVGSDQAAWLDRVETEHDNFRSALHWCSTGDAPDAELRLCGALRMFWITRGNLREGRECAEAALGRLSQNVSRARADTLRTAGTIAALQADYAQAAVFFEQELLCRRALGQRLEEGGALQNLGFTAREAGDYESAANYARQALAVFQEEGNDRGRALALSNLGSIAEEIGDFAGARRNHEESLAISRKLGHTDIEATSVGNLGVLAFREGNYASAYSCASEALRLYEGMGDDLGVCMVLLTYALCDEATGQSGIAARLLSAVDAGRQRIGSPLKEYDLEHFLQATERLKKTLGSAEFNRAWREGEGMGVQEAAALARARSDLRDAHGTR